MDNETKNKIDSLERQVIELTSMLDTFKRDYAKHQHDNIDGTKILTKDIEIDVNNYLSVGYGGHGCVTINPGKVNEQMQYSIGVNKSNMRGISNKIDGGMQFNFMHQPNNNLSVINAFRSPLVTPNSGQKVSTTSGGNTITISGFNFATNELAGALINILNSTGTFIESKVIASNTSTVITISGTWGASTSDGGFIIYTPVFLGSSETVWQRLYTQEGTGGGIRFGMGVTGDSNNVLLYKSGSKMVFRYKDGSTTRYKYLDLAGTGVTWVHTTTEP